VGQGDKARFAAADGGSFCFGLVHFALPRNAKAGFKPFLRCAPSLYSWMNGWVDGFTWDLKLFLEWIYMGLTSNFFWPSLIIKDGRVFNL
jgi:hypothetical protein